MGGTYHLKHSKPVTYMINPHVLSGIQRMPSVCNPMLCPVHICTCSRGVDSSRALTEHSTLEHQVASQQALLYADDLSVKPSVMTPVTTRLPRVECHTVTDSLKTDYSLMLQLLRLMTVSV